MKYIGILFLIFLFIGCGSEKGQPTVKEISYKTTIHCDGCKETLTKRFNRTEGITGFEIDVPTKVVKIKFDEAKIKQTEVKQVIVDAGYEAEEIESGAVKELQ